MDSLFQQSVYFGVILSFLAYGIGMWLKKKTGWGIMNPLLVSIILVIAFLSLTGIRYESYKAGANLISYLLTPATICLAVPLYEQMEILKKNKYAVITGVVTGVISSAITILCFALIFKFDHAQYVSFLPKSITTAIGLGVSEELGGYVPITVAVIVISGVIGNVTAEWILNLLHITEPIAKGIAIGSASHAIGTVKAFELGSVEGAMSSLSIVVSGLLTVIAASLFAMII